MASVMGFPVLITVSTVVRSSSRRSQIPPDGLPVFRRCIGFHGLDVIAVIMTPAPDLSVHIVYLPVVRLDELLLISGQLFVQSF